MLKIKPKKGGGVVPNYHIIYAYRKLEDSAPFGQLNVKIGQTDRNLDFILECKAKGMSDIQLDDLIYESARQRIQEQTKTAQVKYEIIRVALLPMTDTELRKQMQVYGATKSGGEFVFTSADLLHSVFDMSMPYKTLKLFPYQKPICTKIQRHLQNNHATNVLVYAVPRFGKTIVVTKAIYDLGRPIKTLILTNRPNVCHEWRMAHYKVHRTAKYFYTKDDYTKDKVKDPTRSITVFSSLQSVKNGGDFSNGSLKGEISGKYKDIFETHWDIVVLDEAHEGLKTLKSQGVLGALSYDSVVAVSGTPFNIMDDYDLVLSFDLLDELEQRKNDKNGHWLKVPEMRFFAYDLSGSHAGFIDNGVFNFAKLFETETKDGKVAFVRPDDVKNFINRVCRQAKYPLPEDENFPFATDEFAKEFAHTFWVLPGVSACKAMSKLLENHPFFGNYKVVNVAGGGIDAEKAVELVRSAINLHDKTITLSCGRLNTGVTIPEWSGVLMLDNTTAAIRYIQTAFRAKSMYENKYTGNFKKYATIFDFNPDRILQVCSDYVATRTQVNTAEHRETLERLLQGLNVFYAQGNKLVALDTTKIAAPLTKSMAETVTKNGFSSPYILTPLVRHIDENTQALLDTITANMPGLKPSVRERIVVSKSFLSDLKKMNEQPEYKPNAKVVKQVNDKLRKMELVLLGITVRLPYLLLISGFTPDNFDLVKLRSQIDKNTWDDFMGRLTQKQWEAFVKFIDPEVCREAFRQTLEKFYHCLSLPPLQMFVAWCEMVSTFKNPAKEAVLTRLELVQKQTKEFTGGIEVFDKDSNWLTTNGKQPIFYGAIKGGDTFVKPNLEGFNSYGIYHKNTKVLDFFAKTMFYPLMSAFNIIYAIAPNYHELDEQKQVELFNQVVENNVYAATKYPYSKKLANLILGAKGAKRTNVALIDEVELFEHLFKAAENDRNKILAWVHSPIGKTWEAEKRFSLVKNYKDNTKAGWAKFVKKYCQGKEKLFDLTVSNPQYSKLVKGEKLKSIYHYYAWCAQAISKKVALVHLSRWMHVSGGKNMDLFRKQELSSKHYRKFYYYNNANQFFQGVNIMGGLNLYLWDREKTSGPIEMAFDDNKADYVNTLAVNGNFSCLPGGFKILENVQTKQSFSELIVGGRGGGLGLESNVLEVNGDLASGGDKYYRLHHRYGYTHVDSKYGLGKDHSCYKVFVSKTGRAGQGYTKVIIGEPNDICTNTYFYVGQFKTKQEAINCKRFLESMFANSLVGILSPTQNRNVKSFRLLPRLDFVTGQILDKPEVVIDFNKNLDKQLCQAYNLQVDDLPLTTVK